MTSGRWSSESFVGGVVTTTEFISVLQTTQQLQRKRVIYRPTGCLTNLQSATGRLDDMKVR